MSVTIRLTKTGKKNSPSYRIIATKTKTKRDGMALEILGYYNPSQGIGSERSERPNPSQFKINTERLAYWQGVGAITSEAVKKLVAGTYQYTKYNPKAAKEAEKEAEKVAAAAKAEVKEE